MRKEVRKESLVEGTTAVHPWEPINIELQNKVRHLSFFIKQPLKLTTALYSLYHCRSPLQACAVRIQGLQEDNSRLQTSSDASIRELQGKVASLQASLDEANNKLSKAEEEQVRFS